MNRLRCGSFADGEIMPHPRSETRNDLTEPAPHDSDNLLKTSPNLEEHLNLRVWIALFCGLADSAQQLLRFN